MIHDYKFDPEIKSRRKRKSRNRRLLAVTLVALIGVSAAFMLNRNGHPDATDTATPLAPSAQPLLSGGAADGAIDNAPDVKRQALHLPIRPSSDTNSGSQAAQHLDNSSSIATSGARESSLPPVAIAESNLATSPSTPSTPSTPATQSTPLAPQELEPSVEMAEPGSSAAVPSALEVPALQQATPSLWREHEIQKGDTLAAIFKSLELSPTLLHQIINSSEAAKGLSRIRPKQTVRVHLGAQNELLELVLQRDRLTSLHIRPDANSFSAEEVRADVERRIATASGSIESSLFVDGQKAGLSDSQIMDLAGIFGWDIDFALEIRAGDAFSLVYEQLYLDGQPFDEGNILAAEFINQGKSYQAVRYESPDGDVAYFDADGRNKKRAFIRTPVKFGRISSGFTNRRWHPVLKRWRSHKGVDYAAPTGTPIRATGAGRVSFRGQKNGYGRVVFIDHAGKYTTVYGHMSKFASKVKQGSRVKQGQVIGYVGKSGLATGPHLHYEFRVAGVHRNPLRVPLPKSLPLPEKLLPDFRRKTAPILDRLPNPANETLVAKADED